MSGRQPASAPPPVTRAAAPSLRSIYEEAQRRMATPTGGPYRPGSATSRPAARPTPVRAAVIRQRNAPPPAVAGIAGRAKPGVLAPLATKPAPADEKEEADPPPLGRAARNVFTVHCMATAGSVAMSIQTRLMRFHSTAPDVEGRQERAWVRVAVDTTKADAVGPTGKPHVCCSRLAGVNVFLGDKSTVERFVDEAKVVSLRERRASSVFAEATSCPHQRQLAKRPLAHVPTVPSVRLVNFFPITKIVTLKAKMVQTLTNAYGARTTFSVLTPQTFILYPKSANADERSHLEMAVRSPDTNFPENVWIAKQSHGKGGAGVKIVDCGGVGQAQRAAFKALCKHVDQNPDPHPWVVQRYAAAPLLLHGRKFDIRSWVLVTPAGQVWLYREGVCRTSSEEYKGADWDNHVAHVTNHCLQEGAAAFGRYEKGNELPFAELNKRLLEGIKVKDANKLNDGAPGAKPRPMSYERDVEPQLRAIVINVLAAVREGMLPDPYGPTQSFQLLGFDFIIDHRLKVWLLEVNGAPGIAAHLHDAMVDDLLELAVAPALPPGAVDVVKLRGGAKGPNGFELIYDLAKERAPTAA